MTILQELLKNTPNDHPDYTSLTHAISRVELIVSEVNEHQRLAENAKKLAKIVDNIYWDKLKKPQVSMTYNSDLREKSNSLSFISNEKD